MVGDTHTNQIITNAKYYILSHQLEQRIHVSPCSGIQSNTSTH